MIAKILVAANIVLLLFIWIFTGVHYASLPEIIPTHFDLQGNIDGEDHKRIVWLLPSLATFIFFIFFAISRDPKSPMVRVPDNFRNRKSLDLIFYSMLLPVMMLFADSVVENILIAQGRIKELTDIFFILIMLLFLVMGFNIYYLIKNGKKTQN